MSEITRLATIALERGVGVVLLSPGSHPGVNPAIYVHELPPILAVEVQEQLEKIAMTRSKTDDDQS